MKMNLNEKYFQNHIKIGSSVWLLPCHEHINTNISKNKNTSSKIIVGTLYYSGTYNDNRYSDKQIIRCELCALNNMNVLLEENFYKKKTKGRS